MRMDPAAVSPAVELLFEGLVGKNLYYPRLLGSYVEECAQHALVRSRVPTDTFNLVISRQLGARGPQLVERVRGELDDAGLPAAWWTCDGLREPPLTAALERHGFLEAEVDVGMTAPLARLPEVACPRELEVRRVERAEDAVAFGTVIASLFEPPDVYVLPFYERVATLEGLGTRPLSLLLGLVDGRPVATAAVFVSGAGAHVFDIGTRAEARGRGYGSALTHAALRHARAAGASVGALQASPDGLGIYRRLGFEEVCTFRVFSRRVAS